MRPHLSTCVRSPRLSLAWWPGRRRRRTGAARRTSAARSRRKSSGTSSWSPRQIEHLVDITSDDIIDEVEHAIDQHASKIEIKVRARCRARAAPGGEAARREARLPAKPSDGGARKYAGSGVHRQVSKTLRLGKNGTFDLQNLSGDIVVTGGGGNDVAHRGDQSGCGIRTNPSARAAAEHRRPDRGAQRQRRVPHRLIRVATGPAAWTSLCRCPATRTWSCAACPATVRVSTLNGDLRAKRSVVTGRDGGPAESGRPRRSPVISKSPTATATRSTGQTISGTLIARGVKARSVDLHVGVGRSADYRRRIGSHVRAVSLWQRRLLGPVVATRSLRIPVAFRRCARVAARTRRASRSKRPRSAAYLRSDYPLTLQGNPPGKQPRTAVGPPGVHSAGAVTATGGAVLTLQSFSGNITIVKR